MAIAVYIVAFCLVHIKLEIFLKTKFLLKCILQMRHYILKYQFHICKKEINSYTFTC